MMFVPGTGEGGGARSNWGEPRGSEVNLTGLGGVREMRSGPWIEAVGFGSGIGVPSAILWVKWKVLGCARLGVEAEEFMVLSGWGSSSTLILAI